MVSLHLIWTGYSQPGLLEVKTAQDRLFPGIFWAWANLYLGVYYDLKGYELA